MQSYHDIMSTVALYNECSVYYAYTNVWAQFYGGTCIYSYYIIIGVNDLSLL